MSKETELTTLFRESDRLSEDEKSRLQNHFADTIDDYLKAKEIAPRLSDKTSSAKQELVKYICYDCMEEFILGKKSVETSINAVNCPFCGCSSNVDALAESGEVVDILDLRCLSIGYSEMNGHRVFDRQKAIDLLLFMERKKEDGLSVQRKQEIYDQFVNNGPDYYTYEELMNTTASTFNPNSHAFIYEFFGDFWVGDYNYQIEVPMPLRYHTVKEAEGNKCSLQFCKQDGHIVLAIYSDWDQGMKDGKWYEHVAGEVLDVIHWEDWSRFKISKCKTSGSQDVSDPISNYIPDATNWDTLFDVENRPDNWTCTVEGLAYSINRYFN
jgi:hypothetical protein